MRSAIILISLLMLTLPLAVGAETKPETKIGILDLQNQFHEYMKRVYETGNVPILKSEGWDRINYFKHHNPDGIVVYAMVGLEFDMENDVPEEAARHRWESYLAPTLTNMSEDQRNKIDFVEVSPNMVVPQTVEEGLWWARYGEVLCDLVGEAGFQPVILTIGVGGIPCTNEDELKVLDAMIPALRAAHKHGGGWAYHGYSCFYTTDMEHERYFSLRYRPAYEYFEEHAPDLVDMPMILSEGGIDLWGDPRRDGYAYRGTRQEFADWLKWYDDEIKKDPYVLGTTLFKAAGWGWEGFDLEPMAAHLIHYYNTGSMELPRPSTKLGLAIDEPNLSDASVRNAITSSAPVLYTSWKEVRPGGAVELYKQANPDGIVIVDMRAPYPNEEEHPDPQQAASERWDQIAAIIGTWSDDQRAIIDYLDTTPGPVRIRHDIRPPTEDYFNRYIELISRRTVENLFKPVFCAFHRNSIPADGRDWDILGGHFRGIWRERRDAGGIVIIHVDSTYPSMDRNSTSSNFLFAYEGLYKSLLRLEPELFGVPLVIMADRLNLPGTLDERGQQQLDTRKTWLEWYDQELCEDHDVMAVIMNTNIHGEPTPAQQSLLDWYAGYIEDRME